MSRRRPLENYWDTVARQRYERKPWTDKEKADADAFFGRLRERRREERDATCKVYFMRSTDTGRIKIGYSKDVLRRRNEIQAAHGGAIQILLTISGGPTMEGELHQRFAAHKVFGEWFEPAAEILAFVEAELEKFKPKSESKQYVVREPPVL